MHNFKLDYNIYYFLDLLFLPKSASVVGLVVSYLFVLEDHLFLETIWRLSSARTILKCFYLLRATLLLKNTFSKKI